VAFPRPQPPKRANTARLLKIGVNAAEPTCERGGLQGGRRAGKPAWGWRLIADVGTADGNWRMVEAALERHGPLDILILNAGARAMKPVADYAEEDWDKLMDLMGQGTGGRAS
jgi:NAD(P)-dependent dehydrogenase (short-subunit alcohol dehydrogenase family)